MWMFSEDGFFSAVQHFDDTDRLLVRARAREDLERLLGRMTDADVQVDVAIESSPDADYPFRICVRREFWQQYVTLAANAIDYANFKERIHSQGDQTRDNALMQVWSVMNRFGRVQDRRTRPISQGLFDDITG